MSTILLIYVYLSLTKIKIILWLLFAAFSVSGCFVSLVYFDQDKQGKEANKNSYFKYLKFGIVTFSLASLVTIFVPTKSDITYMIGGYAAYEITQSEEAKKIPENTLKAINKFLEGLSKD